MATAADWAAGYLAQARVDLAAASQAIDPSVRAMLLQVTIEKIAKAALALDAPAQPGAVAQVGGVV